MKVFFGGILLSLACVAFVVSCAPEDQPDECGFTWKKARPASSYVTVIEVEGPHEMPEGPCREPGTLGCHVPHELATGRFSSTIWIDKHRKVVGGACDTELHEFKHAAGMDHPKGQKLRR